MVPDDFALAVSGHLALPVIRSQGLPMLVRQHIKKTVRLSEPNDLQLPVSYSYLHGLSLPTGFRVVRLL
jgi:hypothetical protein